MNDTPVSGAYATYRGQRLLILSSGEDWVALRADPEMEIPDAIDRGEYRLAPGHLDPWAKVPRSVIGPVVEVAVTAALRGHRVSVQGRQTDGRIRVWFVGSPAVAADLGLEGDQYMGWSGLVSPDHLTDVRAEESARG